jgi:hypothetical protein
MSPLAVRLALVVWIVSGLVGVGLYTVRVFSVRSPGHIPEARENFFAAYKPRPILTIAVTLLSSLFAAVVLGPIRLGIELGASSLERKGSGE